MSDLNSQADELETLRTKAPSSTLLDQANELEFLTKNSRFQADSRIPGTPEQPKPKEEPSWWKKYVTGKGVGEAALSTASGMVAQPVGAVAGMARNITSGKFGTKEGLLMAQARAKEVQDALTYQPRTEEGKAVLGDIGKAVEATGLQGLGPTEAITLGGLSTLQKPARSVQNAPVGPKALGSVGAQGADPVGMARASIANSSPELQSIVENHIKNGSPINQAVLDRYAEADSLPVPIRLTKGEATGDVTQLSQEKNARGQFKDLADLFAERPKQFTENLNRIRENAAPDIYVSSKPEHGEILIDAYKSKDAKLNADISAKYQALRDANGGQFPLDSKAFVESADSALHKSLLYDQVPSGLRSTLDRLKTEGTMSFENFESMRTNLARIQRSQADGNVKHAAGIIRNSLEEMPMPAGAENLKPLADQARAAAKARFSLIESDPAYKAVVSGKASADKFIDKYIVGADVKDVQALKQNLSTDPLAGQAVASGVINHLKQRAGIIGDEGNFSQAGFNKAVESVRPKLDLILDPQSKKQVETLGNVARYTQAQPTGSFVNTSNTATALMSAGAKNALEGATNVAFKGVPVGTGIRKYLTHRSQSKFLQQAMEPGAGILLRDVK